MKKVILLAACLFTMSATIKAQESPTKAKPEKPPVQRGEQKKTPEERAQKHVNNLDAEVTLTEDQKSKIHTLAINHAKQADAIKVKYTGHDENEEIVKKELDVARKEYHQSVNALLTPEQLKKVKEKKKQMKAAKDGKPAENNVIKAND